LIPFVLSDECLHFAVRVVPRASKSEIAGEYDGALRIRIAAPPVDGAANAELTKTIAKGFGVPVRAVEIISGHSGKSKQVKVRGGDPAILAGFSDGQ
jgi:uncharacterized protein (TIGR00251 family)